MTAAVGEDKAAVGGSNRSCAAAVAGRLGKLPRTAGDSVLTDAAMEADLCPPCGASTPLSLLLRSHTAFRNGSLRFELEAVALGKGRPNSRLPLPQPPPSPLPAASPLLFLLKVTLALGCFSLSNCLVPRAPAASTWSMARLNTPCFGNDILSAPAGTAAVGTFLFSTRVLVLVPAATAAAAPAVGRSSAATAAGTAGNRTASSPPCWECSFLTAFACATWFSCNCRLDPAPGGPGLLAGCSMQQ